ncbi:CRISPR-associated endonuclease Cas1 [Blastochloris sulfoviridis]|uniref:CRISPR-associated endonuclease Cas1 n=1 Tax=Blastochloris sulfoviridis TaxID=50712 RepID=UPI001478F00B|nr:CRISPR-associated endonuclease Cas1 [Blastochloris sulfoviridis]
MILAPASRPSARRGPLWNRTCTTSDDDMTTVHIDQRGADVDIDGDRLVVRVDGERKGTLPLNLIERLVVSGMARVTTRLMVRLADKGIGLVLDRVGRTASATPLMATRADRALRLAQYDVLLNPVARLDFSRPLVREKIDGGLRLLADIETTAAGSSRDLAEARRRMAEAAALAADAAATPSLEVLRGREGAAARAFFAAFATVFAPALDFFGRNRRPPRDPVNVCLSLGYSLAYGEALRVAARHGFDPTLGVFHDIAADRDSLACDLVEPARPHIDRFVHQMFAEAHLRPEDFSGRGEAGCTMGKAGRRAFYRAFEERCAGPVRQTIDRVAGELASGLLYRFHDRPAARLLPPRDCGQPDVDAADKDGAGEAGA